jgi:hypothetical protein
VDVLGSFYALLFFHSERREGKGMTSFGGSLLTKGSLILDPSIVSLLVRMLLLYLGRIFGGPRFS